MKQSSLIATLCVGLAGCRTAAPIPQKAIERNDLCAQYHAAGDYEQAEIQCDLGLQFAPEYADLWVNKGNIARDRKQTDQAKSFYIKALRFNQDQASAYNNLGTIYFGERQYEKARENYERALRLQPEYTIGRLNLALVLKALKRYDNARRELKTLLAVDANLSNAYAELGAIDFEEGKNESAEVNLQKAVQLAPDYTEAWLLLGNIIIELGRPCDAKDAYLSCLELDAQSTPCRNNVTVATKKCALQNKALDNVKAPSKP
jgi:Tfp pilus assembly protein PilF